MCIGDRPRALQGKGSVFFHAGPGKGFEHPPRDHLIDDAVVGIQSGREVLGGKQRVVVGDLFVVHASAGERCGIHPVSYTHLDVYKRQRNS